MATKFKVLIFGSIGAGNYGEDDWTPETDIIIKKVMANERGGNPLNAAQLFLSIADVPYTKTYVPMSVIGNNPEYCWKPDTFNLLLKCNSVCSCLCLYPL